MRTVLAFVAGAAIAAALTTAHVHADPQPALDRQLVERLVRSQEEQTRQLQALVRATEKCQR